MYANTSRVRSLNPPIKLALLEEKSEIEISSYCWNILQFFGYLICILSGVATHLSFEDFRKSDEFCPLFAKFSNLTLMDSKVKESAGLIFEQVGENSAYCWACRHFSILSSLGGGILGLVYMKYLEKLRKSRKLTALLFVPNLIFFGLSISTAVMTILGFFSLCNNIQIFTAKNGLLEGLSCEAVMSLKWQKSNQLNLNENAIISQVSSVVSVLGWSLGTFAFLSSRALTSTKSLMESDPGNKVEIDPRGGGRTRGDSESSTQGLLPHEDGRENGILTWCPCRMYP